MPAAARTPFLDHKKEKPSGGRSCNHERATRTVVPSPIQDPELPNSLAAASRAAFANESTEFLIAVSKEEDQGKIQGNL